MKLSQFLLVATLCVYGVTTVGAQDTINLAWDWFPGDSGYTSGPNGDIAYSLYIRTADDSDYAYDDPVVSNLDNCRWEVDHYSCETTLKYAFAPGEAYYMVAVAYLADSPMQRSLSSNEIAHRYNSAEGGGGGGGGCFVNMAHP